MRRKKRISGRKQEQGIILTLVALFMLGVVGAMAALSIDVVTLYTARSEAQLAADGAALAAARVLANSGMTSDPTALTDGLMSNAWTLAQNVALQVARQNQVGGANLTAAEVTLPSGPGGTYTNPTVTVTVRKTNLPTFFARIWGSKQLTVSASATAEAYNPSGAGSGQVQVAPTCVKPWLLPNLDPSGTSSNGRIFDLLTGAIQPTGLLAYEPSSAPTQFQLACNNGDCSPTGFPGGPNAWRYIPGDTGNPPFSPSPAVSSVSCPGSAGFTAYQLSIAGCVPTPIACNATVNLDLTNDPTRITETADAVNCLVHTTGGAGDKVDKTALPPSAFEFLAGDDNPLVLAGALSSGTDMLVSDSLVTVPVFSYSTWPPPQPVQVIGFVQLFLNPEGQKTLGTGRIHSMVINIAGCGTGATGTPPILGNGASPVAVRLISPP